MTDRTSEYWVGERVGALTYARRYTRGGWHMLGKALVSGSGREIEWDWGADTWAARLLAASILSDAYAIIELAAVAQDDFARQVVVTWRGPTWSYTLDELHAWLTAWLHTRAISYQEVVMPGLLAMPPRESDR